MSHTIEGRKKLERPLSDTTEGQELYDFLLENIERTSQEDDAVHIETCEERVERD